VSELTSEDPRFDSNPESWLGGSVLTYSQFGIPSLGLLFCLADRFKRAGCPRHAPLRLLDGKVIVCLFLEPSTRTSCSFVAAAQRLGGSAIHLSEQVGLHVALHIRVVVRCEHCCNQLLCDEP